jgi:hypothetical protein
MYHDTLFRLGRTIVLGLVVSTAIVTTSAAAVSTGQFGLPPGATVEPVAASSGQFGLPPGATVEPDAASSGQFGLPPGATVEPVAASTEQPGGVQVAPVPSSPVVEVRGGLDWADAGIGAGIAFGGILLLGGGLLVIRRSGRRHRLATH